MYLISTSIQKCFNRRCLSLMPLPFIYLFIFLSIEIIIMQGFLCKTKTSEAEYLCFLFLESMILMNVELRGFFEKEPGQGKIPHYSLFRRGIQSMTMSFRVPIHTNNGPIHVPTNTEIQYNIFIIRETLLNYIFTFTTQATIVFTSQLMVDVAVNITTGMQYQRSQKNRGIIEIILYIFKGLKVHYVRFTEC